LFSASAISGKDIQPREVSLQHVSSGYFFPNFLNDFISLLCSAKTAEKAETYCDKLNILNEVLGIPPWDTANRQDVL
jgi:hypothetical protein